jgi:pyruvate kinase
MNYEILPTLGPSSAEEGVWRALLAAGATGFRLNTSHLTLEQLQSWLDRLGRFFGAVEHSTPVVLDLQGSKWRLGSFSPFSAQAGDSLELVCADKAVKPAILPVPHPDFFEAAPLSGGEISLNDAKIRLALESLGPDRMSARVLLGGELSPHKGVTFTDSEYRRETLNEKDQAILSATRGLGFIRYAISYVKDAAEMVNFRSRLGSAYLIAKLERQPAFDEVVEVAGHADELWVCRGDLGAELGMAGMAEAVHRVSRQLSRIQAPVLMAGQVLEHMVQAPAPTRSEVCYLYECLQLGYRGFVLSDETAIGANPVESCRAAALFKG